MQTTLDCNITSTVEVNVDAVRNSTLNYSDEHINYLYENFSPERSIQRQIEKHLEEEENYQQEIVDEFEYLQQFKEFRPKQKQQEYIRVGRKQ